MKAYFEEKQRFTQWWLWLIIVSAATFVVGMFLNAIYQQLFLGRPWGEDGISDDTLVILSLLVTTSMIGMLLVFFNSVLEIVVDRGSVTYRYFPLIRTWRRIERESILSYKSMDYLMKGYGIHKDLNGNKTINVKGHKAIEFTLHDGSKLLLGTQHPDEFLEALRKMKAGNAD